MSTNSLDPKFVHYGLVSFIVFVFSNHRIASPAISKIYRTDYVYNKKTDAFYKLHIDSTSLHRAKELCSLEGAELLTPLNELDLSQAHAMLKQYSDVDNVWIGDDGKQHVETEEKIVVFGAPPDYDSSEERDKCDVMNRFGEIKSLPTLFCRNRFIQHPFICKVEATDAPYDENCDVFEQGFEYNATVGSCYKIPRVALTWNAAYDECKAVGAHLVVINSEAEHQAVVMMMTKSPPLPNSHHGAYYSAGFRAKPGTRDFVTIFNQTLEEAGFAVWTDHEPNNYNNNEYCGSLLRYDGKLNDFSCTDEYGFICEKEKTR